MTLYQQQVHTKNSQMSCTDIVLEKPQGLKEKTAASFTCQPQVSLLCLTISHIQIE